MPGTLETVSRHWASIPNCFCSLSWVWGLGIQEPHFPHSFATWVPGKVCIRPGRCARVRSGPRGGGGVRCGPVGSCSGQLVSAPWPGTSSGLWAAVTQAGSPPDRCVGAAQPSSGPQLVEEQPRGQWSLPASAPPAFPAVSKAPDSMFYTVLPPCLLETAGGASVFPCF